MSLVCGQYLFIVTRCLTSGALLCEGPLLWLKVPSLRHLRAFYKSCIKMKMSAAWVKCH